MRQWILLFTLGFLVPAAFAHETPSTGIVNLQASANVEVETDTMHATISVEAENYDPAILAKKINEKMGWALRKAKPFKSVKVKGGQYTSHQLYNKRIFRAWRGTQTITLESKNSAQLGKLIGLLQEKLLIKSIRYQVSKEKRDAVNKELIKQAIKNFKDQALVVTKGFGRTQYIINQVNINANNHFRPVYAKSHMMRGDAMMAESAPANLQQSSSNIQVNINGSIRLIQ
ncbi:MAG: hypothetical protein A6F70_09595 [Cycloclasticus sp. symbiont of Bathymodiolus heckerae]|nr:MAG: hypothetical protein A6F70_09595 [Cycloclasticus sp. symbiont of Bathymodiolus heckerae]